MAGGLKRWRRLAALSGLWLRRAEEAEAVLRRRKGQVGEERAALAAMLAADRAPLAPPMLIVRRIASLDQQSVELGVALDAASARRIDAKRRHRLCQLRCETALGHERRAGEAKALEALIERLAVGSGASLP